MFSHKLIVLVILPIMHFDNIQGQKYGDPVLQPVFQPYTKHPTIIPYSKLPVIQPPVIYSPVTQQSHRKPCARHEMVFKFSNVGLRKIGPNFIISDDIITLNLDNNEINDISSLAFRSIPDLQYLDLSRNKIPKNKLLLFTGNNKLRTLIINNNNDSKASSIQILKEYEIFKSLEYLYLCNSQLGDFQIPFYMATPNLIHLHVSNNSITSSNVILDNIPPTLTHLHLDNNLIDVIEQQKLRHLGKLIMDHNSITEVCLEICHNQYLSLKGAVRMHHLSLSKNYISKISVDAFNDTTHLMHLDLSGNRITDIIRGTFNNIISLTKLSLADNRFAIIPNVCEITRLNSLNLTGNRISAVRSSDFCYLRNLEYLYLANNIITTIESGAFIQLETLKYLDLSGNKLRELPAQWITSRYFQNLHLERNAFTKLDDILLGNITSLQNIYLNENPISSLKMESVQLLPRSLTMHLTIDKNTQCTCNKYDKNYDDDNDDDNDDDDVDDNVDDNE